MQQQINKMLVQELDKLPPEAKAALEKTRVDVVRRTDSIEIVIDPMGEPDVEKVKDIMLDNLLAPISRIVTLFGCQVNVEQSSQAGAAEQ